MLIEKNDESITITMITTFVFSKTLKKYYKTELVPRKCSYQIKKIILLT